MPIVRRSALRPPTVKTQEPAPKQVPEAAESARPQLSGKLRTHISKGNIKIARRWPQSSEQYVTVENGCVTVRTPKECTYWPTEFRMRIVRDYRPPNTIVDREALRHLYDPATVYAVSGSRLLFRQLLQTAPSIATKALVIRTEVIDMDRRQAMCLLHSDPAMRVMMVYAFIKRMSFNGVASFSVYDWQPE